MDDLAGALMGTIVGIFFYLVICAFFAGILWMIAILPVRIIFRDRGQREQQRGPLPDHTMLVRAALVLATLGVAVIAYTQLKTHELNHTALMFIGLPALLSLGLTMLRFKSPYWTVAKGITIFLTLSGLLLGEGLICILMAAPAFYFVGLALVPVAREAHETGRRMRLSAFAVVVLLISLEGTHPMLSFERDHQASATAVIALSLDQVKQNLSANPDFSTLPISPLLRLGFPIPVAASGQGLHTGDRREFVFERTDGTQEAVAFVVGAYGRDYVELVPEFDQTKINDWLSWQGTRIEWQAVDANQTQVTVQMNYRRELDPAWYFGPMQKLVVHLAARTMIGHAAQVPAPSTVDIKLAASRNH